MRARDLVLFRVPWTNAYDNLPFGFETANDQEVITFLYTNYSYRNVTLTLSVSDYRSFKASDGNITVPVTVDAQTILTDYNYAAVLFEGKVYFYFIRNSLSLYDERNNGTCSLDLEYDIYLNNRAYFSKLDPQLCVRSHVKDLKYKPSTDTWTSTCHYVAPPVSVNEYSVSSEIMVCWGRLCTSGDFYNAAGQSYMIDGCYPSQKITPYIMFPLFAINTGTFELVDAYWEYDTQTPEQIDLSEIRVNNIEEILQFDLTYYPPFKYSTTNVSGKYRIRTCGLIDTGVWKSYTKESILYNVNKVPYLYYNDYGKQHPLPCVTGVVSKTTYGDSVFNVGSSIVRESFSPSSTAVALNSPQMNVYPIRYTALYVNGSIMPLIFPPQKQSEQQYIAWTINPSDVTPYLTIKYFGGEEAYATKPIPLSNHGFMPTASSQYDAFIRANGNKIMAEQQAIYAKNDLATGSAVLSAAKGVAASALTGSINGMLNTGVGFANSMMTAEVNKELSLDAFYAKLNDYKNAQDSFSIPSANAMSAILQDLVLQRAFKPVDNNEVMSLFTDLTYYGFEKTTYRSLTEPTHECYDYIQTGKAYFPQIPNLAHRRIMEAAFNRGVTCWHFDLIDRFDGYDDAIKTMNRNYTNRQVYIY